MTGVELILPKCGTFDVARSKVLDIQKEYPRAGKFRVRGLLEKQLQDVTRPTLFQTSFQSPQLVLFELDDEQCWSTLASWELFLELTASPIPHDWAERAERPTGW